MQSDSRFGILEPESYSIRFVWGFGRPGGCPQESPQDRGRLEALVCGCFAAAAAPRLGEAVWLGGRLKEGLKAGLCINSCKNLVGFPGPKKQQKKVRNQSI